MKADHLCTLGIKVNEMLHGHRYSLAVFASSSLWGKTQCQQAPDQQPWVGLCWERCDQRGEEWRPGGFGALLKHTYNPVGSQSHGTSQWHTSVHCTYFLQGYFPLSLPHLSSECSICTVPIFCIYILLCVSTSLLCATLNLVPHPSTFNQRLWKDAEYLLNTVPV